MPERALPTPEAFSSELDKKGRVCVDFWMLAEEHLVGTEGPLWSFSTWLM